MLRGIVGVVLVVYEAESEERSTTTSQTTSILCLRKANLRPLVDHLRGWLIFTRGIALFLLVRHRTAGPSFGENRVVQAQSLSSPNRLLRLL